MQLQPLHNTVLQSHMIVESHAQDVAPFTALNASTSGLLDDTIQMAVFRYLVWRSAMSGSLNTMWTVLAVALLSIIVFWIPEDELAARIEVCAALFLTLIGKRSSRQCCHKGVLPIEAHFCMCCATTAPPAGCAGLGRCPPCPAGLADQCCRAPCSHSIRGERPHRVAQRLLHGASETDIIDGKLHPGDSVRIGGVLLHLQVEHVQAAAPGRCSATRGSGSGSGSDSELVCRFLLACRHGAGK